ncbi:MAG: hypothetical protein ACKVQS_01250 [Fimbriimonadaceae bacterium]
MNLIRVSRLGLVTLLVTQLATIGLCQTPPSAVELTRFFLIDSGPSNHECMIGTFSTPSSPGERQLMSYPQYHENSATPWVSQETASQSQYGIVKRINLTSGTFITGTQGLIGLPKTTKAVRVNVKLKSAVDVDLNGFPAYVQCDISIAKPSEIDKILSPSSFDNYRQNHLLHNETQLWVKPAEYNRNVRHVESIIPVEYNADGEPEISYVFNYGIYNYIGNSDLWNGFISTSLANGPSRGSVEMAITLVGWYE